MAYKNREKPYTLIMLEALKKRMRLETKDRLNYLNAISGYEGEWQLDGRTERLKHCLVLNDLFLKNNGVSFQIDALVVTRKKLLIYEVKNHEGEYIYKEEHLYKIKTDVNILNPMYRLMRTKLLFEQLLRRNGYADFQVEAYLVFINPNFTLYECPMQPSILRASNLDRHFEQLAIGLEPLTQRHTLLSDRLCELIIPDEIDFDLPKYTYAKLKKDIFCLTCGAIVPSPLGKFTTCQHCLEVVPTTELICEHIRDYQYLFPNKAVTINAIYEWCGCKISKKRIRAVLKSHFESKGIGRGTHYL
ncbi:NERD domain-containing protein [Desemzia sp. RIT804]|uniref:nuclease-related domain-containing protein n=1 Tax=Desemzia sp. RIT 804 TaxID=2810209 RepID=UPI0019500E0B|nr:nuclease-related domain-containing protein [Desemzia sp. RIT 804]MBM6615394.1 NERD domain-containing protein [Desemzia sp. RIT 804]